MIQKLFFAAVSVLLLVNLVECGTDLENGLIKEYEDNKEGIHQELNELWDGFLEEINDWSESFATHSITKNHDLTGNRESGAQSGKATLYWREGDNKIVIAEISDEGIYEFTIHAGNLPSVLNVSDRQSDYTKHLQKFPV